jgi:hypothetical protein
VGQVDDGLYRVGRVVGRRQLDPPLLLDELACEEKWK